MLTNRKDLFLIVLSFCALWLLFLITVAAYYGLQIFREMRDLVRGFRERIESVDKFIKTAIEKIEHTSTMLQVLVEGFNKLSTYLSERRSSRPSRKKDEE